MSADRSSLPGDTPGQVARRQWPGGPRVVDGEGVGGETEEVVHGQMRVSVYKDLQFPIVLGNFSGGGSVCTFALLCKI